MRSKYIANVRKQLKYAKEQSDWHEIIGCYGELIGYNEADRSAYLNRSKAYRNLAAEHSETHMQTQYTELARDDYKRYRELLAEQRHGRPRES